MRSRDLSPLWLWQVALPIPGALEYVVDSSLHPDLRLTGLELTVPRRNPKSTCDGRARLGVRRRMAAGRSTDADLIQKTQPGDV